MKKLIEKIKNNKVLKFVYNVVYTILFIYTLLILAIVILQRVSDNNLSIGKIGIFNIVSESMTPKYNIGDVLIATQIDPSQIEVGDDIVYKGKEKSLKDKIVTHQVIEKEEQEDGTYKFTTKGIANEVEDPEITEDQILGKIVYKLKSLSIISKITMNLYKFYFIIFVPTVILIFIEVIKAIAGRTIDDDDENDEEENEDDDDDDDEE